MQIASRNPVKEPAKKSEQEWKEGKGKYAEEEVDWTGLMAVPIFVSC